LKSRRLLRTMGMSNLKYTKKKALGKHSREISNSQISGTISLVTC
jgi:hypothetical protein